jgi:Domain of unknown function (DUF1814).
MHKEILTENQLRLLPLLKSFKREFYLVGGTAIALHIGHRASIDFDLFKQNRFVISKVLAKIRAHKLDYKITRSVSEQLNLIISDVKFTFFEYPFAVKHEVKFDDYIKMPSLLDLAAMKAYALGRRAKWKDYVDLYFITKSYYTVDQISNRAEGIFGELFSEKQFRAQLSYHKDIDFSEPIDYMTEQINDDEIKNFLVEMSISISK